MSQRREYRKVAKMNAYNAPTSFSHERDSKNVDRALNCYNEGSVRPIEVFLLRYGAMSNSPMVELENVTPGGGILTAWDADGRKFKIEISQIGGPA